MLSPACPWSSSLRNISTPVTTSLRVSAKPTSSTSSPTFTIAALHAARRHRAAALDREHVLDRHQERLVDVTHRVRDLRVERREQLVDRLLPLRVAVERRKRRAADHLRVVPVELVLVQKLADFHLDQVQHLRVVHRVALVQEHHDVRSDPPDAPEARARASAASRCRARSPPGSRRPSAPRP